MTALVGKVEHSWVRQALRKRLTTLLTASQVIQAPRIGMRRKNKQKKKQQFFENVVGSCNSEGEKSQRNLVAIVPLSKTSDGVRKTVMSQKENSIINKIGIQSSRSNVSHLIQCIPVITKSQKM